MYVFSSSTYVYVLVTRILSYCRSSATVLLATRVVLVILRESTRVGVNYESMDITRLVCRYCGRIFFDRRNLKNVKKATSPTVSKRAHKY